MSPPEDGDNQDEGYPRFPCSHPPASSKERLIDLQFLFFDSFSLSSFFKEGVGEIIYKNHPNCLFSLYHKIQKLPGIGRKVFLCSITNRRRTEGRLVRSRRLAGPGIHSLRGRFSGLSTFLR
jgi:hypothetical protein